MGLDDKLHVIVVQSPSLAVGAVGDEVLVEKMGEGHGHVQVGLTGKRLEAQALDQFDIEHPNSGQ